ncbi:fungal-specific transcription factor domain-domain-containing protein [Naematelia encephala]|uniref:Fungal-specific transcription factor domain-domain-containing protein n=1 Tax=Naematelia encephala TaxID=71784 RepID=A0A1Y2B478_9TREE|nr:fungal-specific transcription factor domain-domain-containing protein [Naematelia encephala]
MDPSLFQPDLNRRQSVDEVKPQVQDDNRLGSVESSDDSDSDPHGGSSADPTKRPRLRLAHACDRCRKRKIRCDTQQPCGPCQATKNMCTFHTPSRRPAKPKAPEGQAKTSTWQGTKRPHSPARSILGSVLLGGEGGSGNLEARLAALEAMLGDVPPKVHNAFLSSLDARLGSGTGVGIKEGKGEGVGVALEALSGSGLGGGLLSNFGTEGWSKNNGLRTSLGQTLAPDWTAASGSASASASASGIGGIGSLGWLGKGLTAKDDEGVSDVAKRMEGMSFFYEDEIGQAKWQGATSGFPLLNLLTAGNGSSSPERENEPTPAFTDNSNESPLNTTSALPGARRQSSQSAFCGPPTGRSASFSIQSQGRSSSNAPSSPNNRKTTKERFFPDRTPRPHQTLNPEASWKVITGVIPPDLMDTLVRCYLSTSHLLWPFLHVPSFLRDYANPQQWGEPGFACFIVAVCTLSSRHVDDPRVRANPQDPSTAGKQYFELFKRLRDLPSADRPTLYSIQAAFLAAIYAFGLGNLSKAFALQAESITLCLDGGLHRSVDWYDHFDPVEKETRKRTFWSIYSWDKQSAALFGRPPIIHLRDCDVTEPMIVDDENLSTDGVKEQANQDTSRICAFVAAIRLHVILEGVIDSATQPSSFPTSPFLAKAASTIARRDPNHDTLKAEEALLEEWTRILPKYWSYDKETANSRDPIRITQAERLHCLEHLVKMIIYRHRFSGFVGLPASTTEEREKHLDYCRKAMQCALTIVADHVHISQRGMMTYYGVHVIHQLAQAGRTLVAVVLNCRNADFRPLIAPSIEGLRSCVGLLRRFSGRYLCGLRSADIIDEFCRICNIPVDSPRVPDGTGRPSPAWLRPVRRRASPSPVASRRNGASPRSLFDFNHSGQDIMSAPSELVSGTGPAAMASAPLDLEQLFNTSDYFDLSAMSPQPAGSTSLPGSTNLPGSTFASFANDTNAMLGESSTSGNSNGVGNGAFDFVTGLNGSLDTGTNGVLGFDYSQPGAGFGGEMLAGEGMDSVSSGLKDEQQGLSAAAILSLLEEGSFDYGSVFTDQAPVRDGEGQN